MKTFFYITLICLIPLSADALMFTKKGEQQEKLFSYYPTPQEIYDDCQKALEIVKTDPKAFMRTYCVAQLHGGLMAYSSKYWVLPPFKPGDQANQCAKCSYQGAKELYEAVEGRYCLNASEEIQNYEIPEVFFIEKLLEVWKYRIKDYNKKLLDNPSTHRIPGMMFATDTVNLLKCPEK